MVEGWRNGCSGGMEGLKDGLSGLGMEEWMFRRMDGELSGWRKRGIEARKGWMERWREA